MIYVKDIRYGNLLNASYFIEDGSFNLDIDMSQYSVGDKVSLMLDVPDWQVWAIKENCLDKEVKISTGNYPCDQQYVWIEFRIVEKRHVLHMSRKNHGHLEPMSLSLCLQAVSWGHEDLFKWLCMGELPSWMREEEIEEYKSAYQPHKNGGAS